MKRRIGVLSIILILLALVSPETYAKKPPKPGGGDENLTGTVYLTIYDSGSRRLHRMDPDGGNLAALPTNVLGEPSRDLHGGRRWFLACRFVGGTYPNNLGRRELFAVREDGNETYTVQLTSAPDLEPCGEAVVDPSMGLACWGPDDDEISWYARRWESGVVVESGIYVADVQFDSAGNVTGLASPPGSPEIDSGGPEHDWSPDGTEIVHAAGGTLVVYDLIEGTSSTITTSARANKPAWSPDGALIAFSLGSIPTSLATIRPDGGGETVIVRGRAGRKMKSMDLATWWTGEGTHLIYRVSGTFPLQDVYRATSSGGDQTNLTSKVDGGAIPVGWR